MFEMLKLRHEPLSLLLSWEMIVMAFVFFNPSAWADGFALNTAPAYVYREGKLSIFLPAHGAKEAKYRLRSFDEKGKLEAGAWHKRQLTEGQNRLDLAVKGHAGHLITLQSAAGELHLWANRGIWFTLPKSGITLKTEENLRGFGAQLHLARDVLVARGFSAKVQSLHGKCHLEIGRTIGRETGYGIRVHRGEAVVLIARGNVGAVQLTASQRLSRTHMQYRDYQLALSPNWRRYVIPLAAFLPRTEPQRRLQRLHSVAIRQFHPAKTGDNIEVDYLGITKAGPRIRAINRSSKGVELAITGRYVPADLLIASRDAEAENLRRISLDTLKGPLMLGPQAERLWISYQDAPGLELCDPPDAPLSSYALPPTGKKPLLVDDFEAVAAVNAARNPIILTGSSQHIEEKMLAMRRKGSLSLRFKPEKRADYISYVTALPKTIDPRFQTLEIKLRGKSPVNALSVGVFDSNDRHPQLKLDDYSETLTREWQTVRLPLVAFGGVVAATYKGQPRIGMLKQVSVVMAADLSLKEQELELARVQLTLQRTPISVARFEDKELNFTALGGVLITTRQKGAQLAIKRVAAGKLGHALLAEVSLPNPRGQAVLGLNLGLLDLQHYRRLCFWARGEKGREHLKMALKDTSNRRRNVDFDKTMPLTMAWQRACIPLSSFGGKLDLKSIDQLAFYWNGQTIKNERVFLDEVVFE